MEKDEYKSERDSKERKELIQKILQAPDNGGKKMKPKGRRGNRFHSCDAFESYTFEGEE